MTTTMKQTKATAYADAAPVIDFDTRLEMASISIGVRLEAAGGEALTEANRAATDALTAPTTAPAPPATPAAVLTLAADIVRERGWMQGKLTGPDGSVCARQAIYLAAGGTDVLYGDSEAVRTRQWAAEELLRTRIADAFGPRYGDVPVWNDSEDTDRDGLFRLLY